uniref:Retrotransposon gag domain-containing protein n=1 Tax=Nicotiana tabacum TaxID=4097 RepID=A0A1S4CGL8_TOBAC
MGDTSARKEIEETSQNASITKETAAHLEQTLLRFREELEQVRNLASLSITLVAADANNQNHTTPPAQPAHAQACNTCNNTPLHSQPIASAIDTNDKSSLIQNLAAEIKKLTSRVKDFEGNKSVEGLNYEDICVQPDVELPEGRDEKIRMKLFMRSLKGDALSWYISQDAKKWTSWVNMASDFMDRSEAAKARPALEEEQMNRLFIRAQDLQYYERLMLIEGQKFSDVIKLGERIEEGIKNGMVTNLDALQATNKALQSGGSSKKKDVNSMMAAQRNNSPMKYQTYSSAPLTYQPTLNYQAPSPTYQIPSPAPPPTYEPASHRYSQPAHIYQAYNSQPSHYPSPPTRQNFPRPRPNFDRKPPRQYTAIAEPIDQLYQKLKAAGYVTPIPAIIIAKEPNPNVCNNPLPDHEGRGIHMIEIEDDWDPKGSIGLIAEGDEPKKPIVTLNPIVDQIQPSEGDVVNVSVPLEFEAPPSKVPKPIEVEFGVPRAPTPFEVSVLPPKAPILVSMTDVTPFKTNAIPWDYTAEARRKGNTYTGEAIAAKGMTRTGRVYTPEHLAESSKQASGRAVKTGPDDFWRK